MRNCDHHRRDRILLAASVCPSLSHDTQPANHAMSDMTLDKVTWTKTVASTDFFKIKSSKTALEKSLSENVKASIQQMIDDHTKTDEKVARVLSAEGMPLPLRESRQSKSHVNIEEGGQQQCEIGFRLTRK